MPVTVKDALSTQGMPTTAGSRILEGYMPVYDAFAVQRLREAGAVILGKNNLDEFAMGSTTENSAYKTTHNPGISSACPAAQRRFRRIRGRLPVLRLPGLRYRRLHPPARQPVRLHRHQAPPTAACPVTASSPTAPPWTRSVPWAAAWPTAPRVLGVIAGHDQRDATCDPRPVDDYDAAAAAPALKGARLGLPKEFYAEGLAPLKCAPCAKKAIETARAEGAEIVK